MYIKRGKQSMFMTSLNQKGPPPVALTSRVLGNSIFVYITLYKLYIIQKESPVIPARTCSRSP